MTVLIALANPSWRRCLLDASCMPPGTLGKCQKFPETQTLKYYPRLAYQGMSQSLWHGKAKVRVKFLYYSRLVGWFLLF